MTDPRGEPRLSFTSGTVQVITENRIGVAGNYSKANAAEFSAAINQHINAARTRTIQGTYRGEPVTHHLDPATGLNVISRNGEFISGWRLSPEQLANVLRNGSLGGG